MNQDTGTIRLERYNRGQRERRVFLLGIIIGWLVCLLAIWVVLRIAGPSEADAAVVPQAHVQPSVPDAPPTAAAPGIAIAWLPMSVMRWSAELEAAGARHGVDPELLAIVMLVESGGNATAVSRSGARGLMQLMPATAAGIEAERGMRAGACSESPAANVDCGAYYLAQQLRRFGRASDPDWQTSVELAAAAYNGGPGSVASGRLPTEALRYRRWVGGMWRERHSERSATYEAWLAAGGRRLVR